MKGLTSRFKTKEILLLVSIVMVSFISIPFGFKNEDVSYEDTSFKLGTIVTIRAFGPEAQEAVSVGFSTIEHLDPVFDQYNPNGTISELNHYFAKKDNTATKQMKIPRELFDVIKLGLDYGDKTDGNYDITIGPLVRLWEMKENEGVLPSQDEIENAKKYIDYKRIYLNDDKGTIKFEQGMSLDLGGIAKGYVVDQVMSKMKAYNITGAVINAGGNVLTMGENKEEEWEVGITNPQKIDTLIGYLSFSGDKAVVSAGNYQRYYMINEKKYGHILNIESGWPEKTVMAVTVIGQYSGEGDVLATSALVVGVEAGLSLIENAGYEGLIIDQNGELHTTSGFNKYFKD